MRKLCWWAIPCSTAIFLAEYLLPERYWLPAGIVCALSAPLGLFLRGKPRLRVLLAAAGLAVGFFWCRGYTALVRDPTRPLTECDEGLYTLQVTGFPTPSAWGSVLDTRVLLEDGSRPAVRLYIDEKESALRPGDVILCPTIFAPTDVIHGQRTDYYPAKGIFLFGYAQGPAEAVFSVRYPPIRFWPQYAAKALKDALIRLFPDDLSGFFIALLTGDKSAMPVGMYAAFQRAGISHVVVVSGLHIGFLATLAAFLLGKRSRAGAALAILMLFFFALLAGGTPSALRAAIMTALFLLAPLVDREPDGPTALAAALTILLLGCPCAAASVSLQLSFASVAGIYLVTQRLGKRLWDAAPAREVPWSGILRPVVRFLATSLSVSAGALLFSTPLAALYFQSVSLVGPLTNLLVLWAVSIAFTAALAATAVWAVCPPLGAVAAWGAALPARWVIWVAERLSRLPYASLDLSFGPLLGVWFAAGYLLILFWLFCPRRIPPALPLSVLALSLCAAVWLSVRPIRASALATVALDVGEGSATLFYSQGHAVLIDCGGGSRDDAGDAAADYLQSLGSSRLDALVLTHFHADHTNGVEELFARLEIPLLIMPEAQEDNVDTAEDLTALAARYSCEVKTLYRDSSISFGAVEMELYAPVTDGPVNERGLSALCRTGEYEVLVTGDMGEKTERLLLAQKALPDIELLIVGHHGAKSSTSPELLRAVKPETAAISTGRNSYGHPAPEVLERLEEAECEIYRTDQLGNITVLCPQDG